MTSRSSRTSANSRTTRIAFSALLAFVLLGAARRATAGDEAAASSPPEPASSAVDAANGLPALGMFLGAKVGAAFRQPFSQFGTAVAPVVEVGKLLWRRRLVVLAQFGFTREVLRGAVDKGDPRLPDGAFTWKLTEWDLSGSLGVLYRHQQRRTAAYGGVLASLHLQESRGQGKTNGLILGDVRERSTAFGGALLLGTELSFGASAVSIEAEAGAVSLNHRMTGDTNLAALTARLGYRLYF